MATQQLKICLWFENRAEEAAKFYTSVFKNSEIGLISRFGKGGFEFHGMAEGTVMTIDFRLNDMHFTALNSNTKTKFNESVSVMVYCDTQEEIDYYWAALSQDGEEGPCGWLTDKFGISWQIIPSILSQLLTDTNAEKVNKVTRALFTMQKINISTLQQASKD